jgi:hypothetical protein
VGDKRTKGKFTRNSSFAHETKDELISFALGTLELGNWKEIIPRGPIDIGLELTSGHNDWYYLLKDPHMLLS